MNSKGRGLRRTLSLPCIHLSLSLPLYPPPLLSVTDVKNTTKGARIRSFPRSHTSHLAVFSRSHACKSQTKLIFTAEKHDSKVTMKKAVYFYPVCSK